jgi:hypothetical protein
VKVAEPHIDRPDMKLIALAKVGKQHRLDELRRTGRIFMKQLREFIKPDDDGVRRNDPDEGLAALYQSGQVKVSFAGIDLTKDLHPDFPVTVSYEHTAEYHLGSFYAITHEHVPAIRSGGHPIDPKMGKFGDALLIIFDVPTFYRRVTAAAQPNKVALKAGPVRYVDKTKHMGVLGGFSKFDEYAYQSEWRILVAGAESKEIHFDLGGSIEDISVLMPFAQGDCLRESILQFADANGF